MVSWCRLLLLAVFALPLSAAVNNPNGNDFPPEKPTMVGKVFEVVLDAKGKKIKDRFVFDDTKLVSQFLGKGGLGKLPFTEEPGKTIDDPIPWKVSFTDAQGNAVRITGEVKMDDLTGTLDIVPKAGEAQTFTFIGGKAGTPAAKRALATLK
jgi:hypothetical protein